MPTKYPLRSRVRRRAPSAVRCAKREVFVPAATAHRSRNPQLLMFTNPVRERVAKTEIAGAAVTKAKKAFRQFHMSEPTHGFEKDVPEGWPSVYIIIGEVEKFEVEDSSGRRTKKVYRGKRPILATTDGMRKLYIFGSDGLGIPSGRAIRVDYKVPADSGRNKWASRWYHPHDTRPQVDVARGGRSAIVAGRGMKINRRGIIG